MEPQYVYGISREDEDEAEREGLEPGDTVPLILTHPTRYSLGEFLAMATQGMLELEEQHPRDDLGPDTVADWLCRNRGFTRATYAPVIGMEDILDGVGILLARMRRQQQLAAAAEGAREAKEQP